ncbi:MAG: preprotein translocase subunit YajC [Lentisphaeria bacterium]|nr:preprotein translocase subunit YajC [Lentisphaeria bacterium]
MTQNCFILAQQTTAGGTQTAQPAAKTSAQPAAKTSAQPEAKTNAKTIVKVPADGKKPVQPEEAQSAAGGFAGMIPMIIVMAVLIYFMWRSQKKEQKRRQEMIDGVKVGDKVVTIGGIYGEIVTVKEQSFIVKIADNTRIELMKSAVSTVPAEEEAKK